MEKTSFLTTGLVAKFLGISVGSVQKLVDQGVLSAGRTLGGHRRISRVSLDAYKKSVFPFLNDSLPAAPMVPADQRRSFGPWCCWVASAQPFLSSPVEVPVSGGVCLVRSLDSWGQAIFSSFDVLFLDSRLGWLTWQDACAVVRERGGAVVLFNHSEFRRQGSVVALKSNVNFQCVLGYCMGYFHVQN
jgi:excisionase family DNA binding protein